YILILGMVNLTISLAADIVAYKLVNLGPKLLPGAPLIFPLTYIIGDIVTEVYGYNVAKKIIWLTLVCELFFVIAVKLIIHVPSPIFWHQQSSHNEANPFLRFVLLGIFAVISSSFINIYIISKLKIFMKGKHFWLRSLGSSAFSGFVLVLVTILIGFSGNIQGPKVIYLILSVYSIEVLYSLLGVWPASIITAFLKLEEQLDIYDTKTDFNPFK
ncbi:MAG: queuosine precursor transporter, partial [Rickettsiella sp.]|nr:queuosine precursor transporter [Rickettsiella sp.]